MAVCSERVKKYLDSLEAQTMKEYNLAKEARLKGFDPEDYVDIPLASDVAERCEGIVSAVAPEVMKSALREDKGAGKRIWQRGLENRF
jgi:DNA polymerase II large subunit